ncbi:hypothetical protein ASZ90_019118 [hydrocarbon metagenome]|uniref:Integral membrane protein n=1 Tax=hydrocarbon metagenome TaxID=938273 RepID=A0A0W8E4B7_9ZZZZ
MTREERKTTYEQIRASSSPSPSFYMLVCISTIIAAYGLLAGSTAVVIGAMLVAPLMGPIFGIALGLSNGDNTLLRSALISEFQGIILAISLGFIIGLVPLRPDFGPEIISRTQPTIYDVIIALASGLAGAYAIVHKKISPALPGVAIATALVPPLATCGLCLAAGNYKWALGAFLLFSANLVAIEFAAAAVYGIAGLVKFQQRNGLAILIFLRRFGLSFIILIVMAVFMTQTLVQMVNERTLAEKLKTVISEQVKLKLGASLSELRYEKQGDTLQIMAIVMTPNEFSTNRIADIEKVVRQEVEPNSHLIVRSLISRDADRDGQVYISDAEQHKLNQQLTLNEIQSQTIKIINEELNQIPGALIDNVDIQHGLDENPTIIVEVDTPTAIDPTQVSLMQEKLNDNLEQSVRLIVRSIISQTADDKRYLYQEEIEPLSGDALQFHNKLKAAIEDQLYIQQPAGKLLEFYYGEKGGDLLVLLQVRTPDIMGPDDVMLMEQALQNKIDERIKVIVRCSVGVDASADYYLKGYDENLVQALQ